MTVSITATLLLCFNDCHIVHSNVIVFEHPVILFLATTDKLTKMSNVDCIDGKTICI